jgi:hypothetical protein
MRTLKKDKRMHNASTLQTREKPSYEEIKEHMRLFPNLDQFMCETILSFSETEISEMLEKENSS